MRPQATNRRTALAKTLPFITALMCVPALSHGQLPDPPEPPGSSTGNNGGESTSDNETAIPTVNEWGMIIMSGLIAIVTMFRMHSQAAGESE